MSVVCALTKKLEKDEEALPRRDLRELKRNCFRPESLPGFLATVLGDYASYRPTNWLPRGAECIGQ
jgi:hypothetical protein